MHWSISCAEILLRPAEIAYEPNDGHLEIFKKVIEVSWRTNIKEHFEKKCSAEILLRLAEIAYEPNDENLKIFKKVIEVSWRTNIKEYFEKNCSAEVLLRLAEIAYEPNDEKLNIFKKVCRSANIKGHFENFVVLRYNWDFLRSPTNQNDRYVEIFKKFIKVRWRGILKSL